MVTQVKFAHFLFSCVYLINAVDGRDRRARPTPVTAQSVVQFVDIQDCLSVPDGIYADPTDCHRYYHCNNGKTYYFRCYDGFVFHPCQLKCSFRDSCISTESCSPKNLNKTSASSTVSESHQPTFDIQQTLSDDGPLSAEHRKLLKLAYSIPILNELDAKLNLKSPKTNEINHGIGTKSETNFTTEHPGSSSSSAATSKAMSKKRIPEITTDSAETQPDTTGTTEATQTYIVKVVFARRNQPGIGNDFESTTPRLTTSAHSSPTTVEEELNTTSEASSTNPDAVRNHTVDASATIANASNIFDAEVNITATNATDGNLNVTRLSNHSMEQFSNSSSHENSTIGTTGHPKLSSKHTTEADQSASSSNQTRKHTTESGRSEASSNQTKKHTTATNQSETSFNQTSTTLSFNGTASADNDNATDITTTVDPDTTVNVNQSNGFVIESNSIDSVSAGPAKNFIKDSTKDFEKSTNSTDEISTVANMMNETISELEMNSTLSNATTEATTENSTSTTVRNATAIDVDETSAEKRNSTLTTPTVEVMGRTGEMLSNITLSCNPIISSAMCDSMSNQTRESLVQWCSELTCQNGGMFISLSNGHCGCVCPNGFKGDSCQDLVDRAVCHCANGGRCVQVINETYTCMCPLGMLGPQCQYSMVDIKPKVSNLVKLSDDSAPPPRLDGVKNGFKNFILCSTNVCFNGGLCLQQVDNLSHRKCFCSDNFGGQYCEKTFAS